MWPRLQKRQTIMRLALRGKPPNWASHRRQSDAKLTSGVRAALLGLPCRFERLVLIVFLQSPETRGQFGHLLPLDYDSAKVDPALCREHHKIFEDWLGLSLEDKLADLEYYATCRREAVASIAHEWLSPDQRDYLVPCGALPPEKRLFQGDVETLLMLLASKA